MIRDSFPVGAAAVPRANRDPAIAKLVLHDLTKIFGTYTALQNVDLTVHDGEFLTVLGPSGSGKTTLLQIVSGLVEPTSGRVLIDGRDETHTPASKRGIGVVFQNYALFPHLTVRENISFPLMMRKESAAVIAGKVDRMLDMVELGRLQSRFPHELSGGQQQRVALARCMVYEPALILMDEPLSALDRQLRETMQLEIKRLHREIAPTIIFVTHDQEEALALSDRICLMNEARIVQVAAPGEIYRRPASRFAARFIGISNLIEGKVEGGRLIGASGAFLLPTPAGEGMSGALSFRPEDVSIVAEAEGLVPATVVEMVYAGSETRIITKLGSGDEIVVRVSGGTSVPMIGATVGLSWPADRTIFLAE